MPTPDFSKIWASASPLPTFNFTDEQYIDGWDFVAAAPPTKSQFDAWFKLTDEKLQYLYEQLQNTASKVYPVGSVYLSFNSADPSTLFGGVWERLKDTFLLANGDTYAANTTGGSATKTITVNNMPAHNHTVNSSGAHTHTATTSSNGAHTHTRGDMNITASGFMGESTEAGGDYERFMKQASGALYWGSPGSYGSNGGIDKDDYIGYFDASRSWTGSTSSNGAHTHTLTTSSNGVHTHTTNNTGGSTPINIMPPYTTVYVWRRVA